MVHRSPVVRRILSFILKAEFISLDLLASPIPGIIDLRWWSPVGDETKCVIMRPFNALFLCAFFLGLALFKFVPLCWLVGCQINLFLNFSQHLIRLEISIYFGFKFIQFVMHFSFSLRLSIDLTEGKNTLNVILHRLIDGLTFTGRWGCHIPLISADVSTRWYKPQGTPLKRGLRANFLLQFLSLPDRILF